MLKNDEKMSSLILEQFNSVTMENAMKPDYILNQERSKTERKLVVEFNQGALSVLEWAKNNGLSMRGHTLIWYSQTPEWIFHEGFDNQGAYVGREAMLLRMESMISGVFEELDRLGYIDLFYAYDVINEAWVDECKVTGNSKALEATVQPMKVWLYAKKSGKATLTLITEGEDDIVLQIEIVESEEILNDVTSKITMTEKSYLKMGTDGKVKEYYSLMLNNETSSPVYAAPISWEERANEPSFKLIKANKSKTIKKIVVTHDSIDEAKNYYYLSKKQVKKLKAGKTVVIETNPIQVAFKYQDLYFHTVRSLY